MKFNFTPRNIAITVLLILTLILGIVSIIIATRLGQQNNNTVSVDSHGCQDYPPKNEHWCDFTNQCQGPDKPCESTPVPPAGTCTMTYANGCVSRSADCSGPAVCEKHNDSAGSATCSGGNGTVTINPGQTVCANPSCGSCEQIDCNNVSGGNGGVRKNGGECTTPPQNPPPPVSLVCGDAKCKTGELCERTAANGTTYKLCTSADITAGTAPTGAASPTCNIATCTVPAVNPPPVSLVCGDAKCKTGEACERTVAGGSTYRSCTNTDITAGTAPTGAVSDCNITSCSVIVPPPISTPLPSTAVISDDFDRLLIGFMFVILGFMAYRFNLIGKVFENLNALTDDDAIRNTALNKFLKNSRGNFEKKVEKDFDKEK